MATTWTCAQCGAPNEDAAAACAACGNPRVDAAALDAGTTAAAPATAATPDAAALAPAQGSWPAAAAAVPPLDTAPAPATWSASPAAAPAAAEAPARDADPAVAAALPPAGDAPAPPPFDAPPPPMPGAPAPGGWPGAPVAAQPQGKGKQAAKGILANVGARVLVIVAIVAIGGIVAIFVNAGRDANGTITKSGEVPATELRLGDCWDLQGDAASFDENSVITKTTGRPCTEAHHYEVFFVGSYSGGTDYPTNSAFNDWAAANCDPAYETYVGTAIDQSSLTYYVFFPDQSGWKQGDRGMQCSLADPNLKPLTKSMKSSGY